LLDDLVEPVVCDHRKTIDSSKFFVIALRYPRPKRQPEAAEGILGRDFGSGLPKRNDGGETGNFSIGHAACLGDLIETFGDSSGITLPFATAITSCFGYEIDHLTGTLSPPLPRDSEDYRLLVAR
jgi:hypothetical protein